MTPADNSEVNMTDVVTSKFIIQRFKSLTKGLRCSEEDVARLEAAAILAAKAQTKKIILQLMKLIQRNGYPRSCYREVRDLVKNDVDRSSYLYSWEDLSRECGMEGNESDVKEIVYEALHAINNSETDHSSDVSAPNYYYK